MPVPVLGSTLRSFARTMRFFKRSFRSRSRRLQERVDFLTTSVAGLTGAVKGERAALDEAAAEIRKAQAELDERVNFLTTSVAGLTGAVKGERAEFDETAAEIRKTHTELSERIKLADAGLEEFRHTLAAQTERLDAEVLPRVDDLQKTATAADRRANNAEDEVWKLWRWADKVKDRLEFLRCEILFEVQSKITAGPGITAAPRVQLRTLDDEKLLSLKEAGLRLNLGSGHKPLEGYLNVDARELPGVDMVAEASDLLFEPGSVEEIFSAHFLEHFPMEILRRRALPHWFTLLKPGGIFSAVVPDAEAMIRAYVADSKSLSFDDLREVLYGEQEYEGNFHYTMFSQPQLESLLTEQGFVDITWVAVGRRNGKCLEMEIKAVKRETKTVKRKAKAVKRET